jgi:hypothetical protein
MKTLILADVFILAALVAVARAGPATAYIDFGNYYRLSNADRLPFVSGVIDAINERAFAPSEIRWSAVAQCLNRFGSLAAATAWAESRAAQAAATRRMSSVIITGACSGYSPRTVGNALAYYNAGKWLVLLTTAQRSYVAGVADAVNEFAAPPNRDWGRIAKCLNQFQSIGQASDWVRTYVTRVSDLYDAVASAISSQACNR